MTRHVDTREGRNARGEQMFVPSSTKGRQQTQRSNEEGKMDNLKDVAAWASGTKIEYIQGAAKLGKNDGPR